MIYVTSDWHGCEETMLRSLLDQAGFSQDDFLFVLGDVIDRGESGVAHLRWLTEQTNVQLILGNHEAMLLSCRFLFDPVTEESLTRLDSDAMSLLEQWRMNGAEPTLRDLRTLLKTDPEVLQSILDYLEDAPWYEELTVNGKRFVLVHGGLANFQPDRPLSDYFADELMWCRPYPQDRYFEDATVIVGHTPTAYYDRNARGRAYHADTWICIDTGAAQGDSPMLLRLDDMREFYCDP